MRYVICAVRDRVADCFGTPIFVTSTGAAIRSFGDEINRADTGNTYYKHPDDFDLFELGAFIDATATFELLDSPRQLALGKDLKRDRE